MLAGNRTRKTIAGATYINTVVSTPWPRGQVLPFQAMRDYVTPIEEIGEHFGLHYSRVSRIVAMNQ